MLNLQLSLHFDLREFRCQKAYKDCPYCGGSIRVRNIAVYQAKVYRLEILRHLLTAYYGEEVEIIISRGDSCRKRNCETSSLPNPDLSWHWRGCAIDIFARIKASKEPVPIWLLYQEATRVYDFTSLEEKRDHIHITLARTQETPP